MRSKLAGSLAALLLIAAASQSIRAEYTYGVTNANRLVLFDTASPTTLLTNSVITGVQSGESIVGIDFRPATGQLFGLGSGSRLYQINTNTAVATQVGTDGAFTLTGTKFGFDFNPTVDRIRVVSNTGQNIRLNPITGGLAATDTSLAYAAGDPNAAATPSIVEAAYTNSLPNAATTTLYDIDSALGILATQNPPNNGTLNTVGSLGVTTSALVGFDISGFTGVGYVSITPTLASNFSTLYSINLNTGATTLIGNIGVNSGFNGPLVALSVVPEPSSIALMGLGTVGLVAGLIRRRRLS